MTDRELMLIAVSARENSYSPYSGYKVGAALLTLDGEVFTGCNIENSAFTPTVCAERVAVFKAISCGKKNFEKIAVVGGNENLSATCTPCGVCRQVLAEFSDKITILTGTPDNIKSYTLNELLPYSFGKTEL